MKDLTDEKIMIKVAAGELNLASLLFDRYYQRIYNYSLKMTIEKEVSKDITQEVFFRIIKYRGTYKGTAFSSWIYSIARNLCFENIKKKKKKKSFLENLEVKNNIETNYEASEFYHEKLNRALSMLSTGDREIIVMSRYQGMKHEEIASILQISHGAVRTKIHRAIHKLKSNFLTKISMNNERM